jgi:hypothetical protein
LQEIEREDEVWEQSRRKKPKHGKNLGDAKKAEEPQATTTSREVVKEAAKTVKSNAPSGFY